MKKSIIILICSLVLAFTGLGVGGYFFYNHQLEKNTRENIVSAFEINVRTDISSFVSQFSVLRDGEVIYPFGKQTTAVFTDIVNKACAEYVSEGMETASSYTDRIVNSVSNATASYLQSVTTDLSEYEKEELINGICCITVADLYKTSLDNKAIGRAEFSKYSEYISSYLDTYVLSCASLQEELDNSVLSLSDVITSFSSSSENTIKTDVVKEFLNKLDYVNTFISYYEKYIPSIDNELVLNTSVPTDTPTPSVTPTLTPTMTPTVLPMPTVTASLSPDSQTMLEPVDALSMVPSDEPTPTPTLTPTASPTPTPTPTPTPNGYKELLPLTDKEIKYLDDKISDCLLFISKNRNELSSMPELSSYEELLKASKATLESEGTLDYIQINELGLIRPNVLSLLSEYDENSYLSLSDKVLSALTISSDIETIVRFSDVENDNLIHLVKSIKFGLDRQFWGNEELIAMCDDKVASACVPVILANFNIKSEIHKTEKFVSSVSNEMSGDNNESENNIDIYISCFDDIRAIEEMEDYTYEDLSSLEESLKQVEAIGFANKSSLKDKEEALQMSVEALLGAEKALDDANGSKAKKAAKKAIKEAKISVNDGMSELKIELLDVIVSTRQTIEVMAEDEVISKQSLTDNIYLMNDTLKGIQTTMQLTEEKVFEYIGVEFSEISESLSESIGTSSEILSKKESLTETLNSFMDAKESIKGAVKDLTSFKEGDDLIYLVDSLSVNIEKVKELQKINKDTLTKGEMSILDEKLSDYSKELKLLDLEKMTLDPKSKTYEEDLSLLKDTLSPLTYCASSLADYIEADVVPNYKELIDETVAEEETLTEAINALMSKLSSGDNE